jgi:acyl carrier protein
MTPPATLDEARDLVIHSLLDVAPDLAGLTIRPDDRFQEDLDLDSMDLLNLLAAISERSGVEIPEADYAVLGSVAECAAYLAAHA